MGKGAEHGATQGDVHKRHNYTYTRRNNKEGKGIDIDCAIRTVEGTLYTHIQRRKQKNTATGTTSKRTMEGINLPVHKKHQSTVRIQNLQSNRHFG